MSYLRRSRRVRGRRRARSPSAASTTPFAVQRLVIPDVLAGRDVLVKSPTGSGKTLAFGVPLVDRIERRGAAPRRRSSSRRRASSPARSSTSSPRSPRARAPDDRRRLRRRRHPRPGEARAPRRHPRRDARPPARPARARRVSLGAASSCSCSTRPTGCSTWASSPSSTGSSRITPRDRQTLLFSATLEGEVGRIARAYTRDARRHEHAPAPERRGRRRAPLRARRARGQGRRARRRARRPRARPHARLRAHQARRRPARQAARRAGRRTPSRCTATSRRPSASARSPASSRRRRTKKPRISIRRLVDHAPLEPADADGGEHEVGALDRVVEVGGGAERQLLAALLGEPVQDGRHPLHPALVEIVEDDLVEREALALGQQRPVDERDAEPSSADDRELHGERP